MKGFRFFFLIIVISVILVGCASQKEVATSINQSHVENSVSARIDSFLLHDSIRVHDSIYVAVLGDTIYKEKFHTIYRDRIQYKYKLKTDTLIVKDTISQAFTETISSPTQKQSLWDRARIVLANLVICIAFFAACAWLLHLKKN